MSVVVFTSTSRPPFNVKVLSKRVTFVDLAVAAFTGSVNFASALPAGGVFLTSHVDVTVPFQDGGNTTLLEATIDGATTARFGDYIDLSAVEVLYGSKGTAVTAPGLVGVITPVVTFTSYSSAVNLDTLVQGSATFYVHYIDVTGFTS